MQAFTHPDFPGSEKAAGECGDEVAEVLPVSGLTVCLCFAF